MPTAGGRQLATSHYAAGIWNYYLVGLYRSAVLYHHAGSGKKKCIPPSPVLSCLPILLYPPLSYMLSASFSPFLSIPSMFIYVYFPPISFHHSLPKWSASSFSAANTFVVYYHRLLRQEAAQNHTYY